MMNEKSYVIITDAPKMNYLRDYVSLPKNYGSEEYYKRDDVKAICDTVYKNLNELNSKTQFVGKIKSRKVLIKPNLVSVYHNMGFKDTDYPESTDPRVFDAVVSFFKQYTDNIIIIESSGKGMPTMLSFKVSGLDRVAERYGAKCIALEKEPVVRYMLPKAEIMKEVYLPEILDEVVKGNAFYISVPKMKTNLYTGATLGFKNAMGTLPYYLRWRNHNYNINKKLVDLLYLFKPDLTVIDGIIGGEGCTPAPVDPVEVGVIISGNNCVETDRVATMMMDIDPNENKLIMEATKRGFNDQDVSVIGNRKIVTFRKADPTMMDEQFIKDFPNVKVLVGHMKNNAPKITDIENVSAEIVRKMEKVCDGGCLAGTKTSFEMMKYTKNLDRNFELVVIFGEGVTVNGREYYFDRDGRHYDIDEIKKMKAKKMPMGECTKKLREFCEFNGQGCMNSSVCMMLPYKAVGSRIPLLSLKNKYLLPIVLGTIDIYLSKKRHVRSGKWVDCPYESVDKVFEIPQLNETEEQPDFIEWPLPVLTPEMKRKRLKEIKLM